MPTKDEIAANLLAMTEPPSAVGIMGEGRASIENPNVPLTAGQLASVLNYGPTRSGVEINERTALSLVAVFAAIRILAESVAMLPLLTFSGDAASKDRKQVLNHPVAKLLATAPNPEMTAAVWKETAQGHLGGWGNSYGRITFDNAGRPKAIYPLLPDRTRPERVAGQLRYVSNGDVFAPEEILHIPGLGFDGLKGYSPIALARETIGLGKAAEVYGASFFGNGANMSGVLSTPNKLTTQQRTDFETSWNNAQSGLQNTGKTALLDAGVTYTRIGISPDDAQFLQTRKFQVNEIARLYRIPPHMLGDLERSTNNNIQQQSLEFLIYTLAPWLEKWEQECNRKLFSPSEGLSVSFDERRLLRTDNAARQAYYASARQWGFLSVNEIRSEEGMNGIGPDGDIYLQPANMTAAGQPTMTFQPPAAKTDPAKDAAGDDPAARDIMATTTQILTDAISRMVRKEANAVSRSGFTAEKAQRFYADHESHVIAALAPAASLLVVVAGCDEGRAAAAVNQYAKRRAGPGEVRNAEAEALALITEIKQSNTEK